jgi:hypothetical protein
VTAVDVEDTAVVPDLGRRAYGGAPPSDRRSVARARLVRRIHDGARSGRTPRSLGAQARGEGTAWDGGRPWAGCGTNTETGRSAGAARGRGRRRGAAAPWPNCFAGHPFENDFLKNLVHIFEYESCRSSYPLQLSKRLYRVFLNRFCRRGLPTLNATHLS